MYNSPGTLSAANDWSSVLYSSKPTQRKRPSVIAYLARFRL